MSESFTPPTDNPLRFGIHLRALDKVIEIQILHASKADAERAFLAAAEEIKRIERKYSLSGDGSVVVELNRNAFARPVSVDSETSALLQFCIRSFEESQGVFDISVPFTNSDKRDSGPVQSAASLQQVECNDSTLRFLRGDVSLDFTPILREYLSDQVVHVLNQSGVTSGFISTEGVVRVLGPQSNGTAWNIGILDPRKPQVQIHTVAMRSGAVVTWGEAQIHQMESKEGASFPNRCDRFSKVSDTISVSVVADTAMVAGTLAKVAILLDCDKAQVFLQRARTPYTLVLADGRVIKRDSIKSHRSIPIVYRSEGK